MARKIEIVDHRSGKVADRIVPNGDGSVTPHAGSTVRIGTSHAHVAGYQRDGLDLVITFDDGTTLRIQGYFDHSIEVRVELIFIDPKGGEAWRAVPDEAMISSVGETTIAPLGFDYELLPNREIDAESSLEWLLPLLLGGGGAAVAAGSGGGDEAPPLPVPIVSPPSVKAPAPPPVDATSPNPPVVNPSNGTVISGLAEPNATVRVDINGDGIAEYSVVAGSDGIWSITPATPIPDGTTVTATATDPAGNVSGPSRTIVDAMPPAPPVIRPTNGSAIEGSAEPGSTVSIDVDGDGTPDHMTVTAPDGTWSVTPDTPVPDGATIEAVATDPTGNRSPSAQVTVDATVPVIAINGPVEGDDIVNAAEAADGVAIAGTTDTENGQTVAVTFSQGGNMVAATAVAAAGAWSVLLTAAQLAALGDGSVQVTATVADIVGNAATPATHSFTIDTAAPGAPVSGLITDDVGTITGPVANGGITDDSQPSFAGGGAEPNSIVNIYDNGILIGTAAADGAGAWTLTPATPLADGPHAFTMSSVDAAGNEGPQSATPYDIIVDTQVPAGTVLIDSVSDDTGAVDAFVTPDSRLAALDHLTAAPVFVTSDNMLTIFGHLTAPLAAGEMLQVSIDNGASWIDIVPSGTEWTYVDGRTLTDGAHDYQARIISPSGIPGAATTRTVIVDTAAPATIAIDSISTDTGTTGDSTTSDTSLIVGGTLSAALGTGEVAQISIDGGTTWVNLSVTDTRWSYTDPRTLGDGSHVYQVRTIDTAGNASAVASQAVTVDTTAPGAILIDAIENDTGTSASDFLTSDVTLTIAGHLAAALAAGETAQISIDNGATWIDLAPTGTNWSYADGRTLTDGTHDYQVRIVDAAGNAGASDTRKVAIDTTPPGAIIIASIDVDSGASDTDFITSDSSLVVNGTLAAELAIGHNAETAQISIDGGATWIDLTVAGTSWSYTDGWTLTDGSVDYQVRIIDRAGNVGPVDTQTVTVDTTAIAIPTVTAVTDDTGASASDFVTSDNSLTVSGTLSAALAAGDRAQISIDGGATWTDVPVVGTSWSYIDGRTLDDGIHIYQVRTLDPAGNIQNGASQTVTVDASVPTQSILIDSIEDDTGSSASDFLTSDTTPTVVGHLSAALGAGESAQISLDGGTNWTALSVIGTGWSHAVPAPLAEGANSISVRVIDTADNVRPIDRKVVTIDTVAPAETAAITSYADDVGLLTGGFESGTSTDDASLLLNGTLSSPALAGQIVQIHDGVTLIGTVALSAGDTNWTFSGLTGLADGSYSYTARVADSSGNASAVSPPFTITVDTVAPTVKALTIDNIDTDTTSTSATSLAENADFITRDTTLRVSGVADIATDGMLQISADGGATWTSVPVDGGAWSHTDPTPRTSDVTYQLRVIDAAGNVAAANASQLVTVDSVAPVAGVLAPILIAADDTGMPGDNVTTDTNLTFSSAQSGLKDAAATIGLVNDVNNNGIYDQGIDGLYTSSGVAGGAWSLSTTLKAGQTYNLGFVQFDTAGNFSRLSPTSQISIVSVNDHMTGGFTATANAAPTNNATAGMGIGIDQTGQLQLSVRNNVLTQTSQTTSANENPTAPVPETVTNTTFLDYNRDGNSDYATSGNAYGGNAQTIYTGQSNGTHIGFRQPVGLSSAMGGVVAFDKEGDGYLDLIWGDWGNDNSGLSTVRNMAGVLTPGSVLTGGLGITPDREVSGVDIDNDGDIDLALHSSWVNGVTNNNSLSTVLNNGSGVYSLGQQTPAIFNNINDDASSSVSMTWADFDGDGDLDLYLNRTNGTDVSGIFINDNGVIGATKTAIGDIGSAVAGGASVAVDWNHDGKMDVAEFANSSVTGPIQLYMNTSTAGALSFGGAPVSLATGQANISGAAAVDFDWDGDVDIIHTTALDGAVKSIANTNQVQDGTALHLRIVDQNGINSYYGNIVQLFDSKGKLVATQILNPQSGVGVNDSSGIVNFCGLSATESYTAALVRTVNGVSQDVGGGASLSGGAANLTTIENVNRSWTGLVAGAATSSYILSGESGNAVNHGTFAGTGYNDNFFGTDGNDSFVGAGGWSMPLTPDAIATWSNSVGLDIVDYGMSASGVTVNLAAGTATGQGTDILSSIEGIRGSSAADSFTDSAQDNLFEGRGGNDIFNLGAGGRDLLVYKMLDTGNSTGGNSTGGNGADTVNGFTLGNVASTTATTLDLRDLLRNYGGTANTYVDVSTGQNMLDHASTGLTSYLNLVQSGGNTLIQVDIDGNGSFTTVATLTGITTTLPDLLANHQLWVASNDTGTSNAADNLFEGRGGNDLIHLAAGGQDSILMKLLDAADAAGGNGMDAVTGFKLGTYEGTPDADRIDLKDLLIGYAGDADGAAHYVDGVATMDVGDTLANYLRATIVGGDTVIGIDRDGGGEAFGFTDIVTLRGVQTDLATLLANHQLVVA